MRLAHIKLFVWHLWHTSLFWNAKVGKNKHTESTFYKSVKWCNKSISIYHKFYNMKSLKFFTVLLAVAIIAGVGIFYACKKEEAVTPPIQQKNIDIDVDLSSIDFKKIGMSNTRSGQMLVFESFEDYTEIIDALLAVCEQYSADYLIQLEAELGMPIDEADEDIVAAIIARDNFYPYNPIMNFTSQIGFTNDVYSILRGQEINWTNSSSHGENPFDEIGMGYVQSAMHNASGQVQIAKSIGDQDLDWLFDDGSGGGGGGGSNDCRKDGEQYKDSPKFVYNNKTRILKGMLKTTNAYTHCKTGNYYQDKFGNWILWTNRVYLKFSGAKSCNCPTENNIITDIWLTENTSWTGLTEKYFWHDSKPTYLTSGNNMVGMWGMHSCDNYNSTVITNLK